MEAARRTTKEPSLNLSLDGLNLEESGTFTQKERQIMDLLLLRKMRYGVLSRIEGVVTTDAVNQTISIESDAEIGKMLELEFELQSKEIKLIRDIALGMGIDTDRFEKLHNLVIINERNF